MLDPHQISNRIAITAGAIVLAATLLPSAAAKHVPDGSDPVERGYDPSGVIARPTAAFRAARDRVRLSLRLLREGRWGRPLHRQLSWP